MFKKLLSCAVALFLFVGVSVSFAQEAAPTIDPKVKDAMTMLKDKVGKLGAPSLSGMDLMFGTTKINDNFTIVDEVKLEKGCAATIFVKDGDNFMRVSTNVMAEGNRAVGTALDVRGKAYAALVEGQPFYGTVEVVGKSMETGYEPIKDASGNVIGAFFVGF